MRCQAAGIRLPARLGLDQHAMQLRCSFVCRKPTTVAFSYNSSSGITFIYNTTATSQADAEFSCRENGGHLASFASSMEQVSAHAAESSVMPADWWCVVTAR